MPQKSLSHVPPTLVDAISDLAKRTETGFTFVRSDGTDRYVPYPEVREEAARRGAHLLSLGMKKGDRLAMVIPDGDEFVLSFLGAIYAGIVPVPIYPQLSFKNIDGYHDTVGHIVRASGAKRLLTTQTTREYVEPVRAKTPSLEAITVTSDFASAPAASLDTKVDPDDLCFLQFTSGSTSRPKGVMVSHGNLSANCGAFMKDGLAIDAKKDVGVSWLPLFHDMGLIGFVLGPIFWEISVVLLPTPSFVRAPRLWLDRLHKHRGSITYAPNFAYQLVTKRVKEKDLVGLDLSCVRAAGCGAEPIQRKTLMEFAQKLAPAKFSPRAFVPSYGMAEATLAITFRPLDHDVTADVVDSKSLTALEAKQAPSGEGTQELVDCGRPFEGHEIAIVDENDNRLGERKVGQIITRGPSVCKGYFEEPELTAAAFKDGWLYTGDLGYVADGDLYICGRLKDIIIVRGRNFYPQDIEWVVSELPGIRRGNVVAFGVGVNEHGEITKDGSGEEHLVICAEAFSSEAAGLVEAIMTAVTARIGLTTHKVEIVPQGALPRTSSGKPQRRKTKQMFLDGTLPQARGVQSKDTDPSEAAPA